MRVPNFIKKSCSAFSENSKKMQRKKKTKQNKKKGDDDKQEEADSLLYNATSHTICLYNLSVNFAVVVH